MLICPYQGRVNETIVFSSLMKSGAKNVPMVTKFLTSSSLSDHELAPYMNKVLFDADKHCNRYN